MTDKPLTSDECAAAEKGASKLELVIFTLLACLEGANPTRFTPSVQMGRRYLQTKSAGRDFLITIEDAEVGGRARAREMEHHLRLKDRIRALELEIERKTVKPATLTPGQWGAFCDAERQVYNDPGALAFSDVNTILESEPLVEMWEQAEISIMSEDEKWDDHPRAVKDAMIARRVARAWAVCVFGPEFIMK